MIKNLVKKCLIGASIGFSISSIITIIVSLAIGDGNFYPVSPKLIEDCGTEINAVILQSVGALFYGAVCGGASIIWRIDSWSLLRQTITHLIVCSLSVFPIGYFMYWMEKSVWGITTYFSIFVLIYFIIWILKYYTIKKQINKINIKLQCNNKLNNI